MPTVTALGGHLMVQVKANQPTPHTKLKRLPWADVPVGHRTRERGHGPPRDPHHQGRHRGHPGRAGLPHAQQAVRIHRTRTIDLADWARHHWHIENRLHWVRDVTFAEDAHQARTGNGPTVAAVLRNTAIGYHRSNGEPNIARATRHANRRTDYLINAVTSTQRTQ